MNCALLVLSVAIIGPVTSGLSISTSCNALSEDASQVRLLQMWYRAALAALALVAGCNWVSDGGLPTGFVRGPTGVTWAGFSLADADSATFETLQDPHGLPTSWGRDKANGYFRQIRLPDSHGPSLDVIGFRLAKDDKQVYRGYVKGWDIRKQLMENRAWKVVVIPADPATFRVLEPGADWYADKDHVFYIDKVIEHAAPATIRRVDGMPLWRDDHALYDKDGRIETVLDGEAHVANPDRFRRLDGPMAGHSSDGVGVWRSSGQGFHPIHEADATTWQSFGNGWSKDVRHVYKNGKIIEAADAATFMKLSPGWGKDATMVWAGSEPDPRWDAATFEVVRPGVVKDKSGTYKYDNWRERWRPVDQKVDGLGELERLPVGWHEHEKARMEKATNDGSSGR